MKADGYVVIKTGIDNSGLEEGLDEAKSDVEEFKQDVEKSISGESFNEATEGASALGNELSGATEGALLLGGAIAAIGAMAVFGKVVKVVNNIKNALLSMPGIILNITKKVAGWALGLFGIKSAYRVIRNAVSSVMSNNEQVKNQIDVMKGALASAIEPLVTRVVNLVYTLFSYINDIIKALTGVDLFAKAKKNLQSGAKSSKEINKQLASFDEMNVLKDNQGSESGSGLNLPDLDSSFSDFLEKIKKLFLDGDLGGIAQLISEKIVSGLNKIADAIANIDWASIGRKISEFLTNIDFSGILVGLVRVFGEAVLGFQNMMLAIDWPTILSKFITGLKDAVLKIGEYISLIRWDDIGKTLSDTFLAIDWGGVGTAILTTIWEALKGIFDLITNIDWGAVVSKIFETVHTMADTIIGFIQETDWNEVGKTVGTKLTEVILNIDWLGLITDILNLVSSILGGLTSFLAGFFESVTQEIWRYFTEEFDWNKFGEDVLNGLVNGLMAFVHLIVWPFEEMWKTILSFFGIHSPSTKFEGMGIDIIQGLINGISSLIESVKNTFVTIWDRITEVFSNVGNWFRDRFQEAWENVKNVFNGVGDFFGKVWNKIKSKFTEIGTKAGDAVGSAFKTVINAVLKGVETVLNTPISAINTLLGVINAVPGINLKKLNKISLPRLARGGIVNMPGKGVYVGGAVAGESGKEGVIPLTDSQQMAILGEAIGKYITINASITNTMNGRIISRELQKINNENNFAYNR